MLQKEDRKLEQEKINVWVWGRKFEIQKKRGNMTKQLETKEKNEVSTVVHSGIEGLDERDIKRGNIILVQNNSTFLIRAGHRPGTFVNSATGQALKDTTFVPCYMTKYYDVYEFATGKSKGDWKFRTMDEHDPRLEGKRWRPEGDLKAEVVPVLAVVGLFGSNPAQVAFKKATGYPAGQKLYTIAVGHLKAENAPVYAFTYKLEAKEAVGKGGDAYWQIDVTEVGPTAEEDFYKQAEALSKGLSRKEVVKEATDTEPFDAQF